MLFTNSVFFSFFGRNEKGLLNFVSERIKLVYRINNTRYNIYNALENVPNSKGKKKKKDVEGE